MVLNKTTLIAQAAAAKTPLMSDEHLPNVTIDFERFAKQADLVSKPQLAALDQPQGDAWLCFKQLWEQWSNPRNQPSQTQLFNACGFNVCGVFHDPAAMSDFVSASHLDDDFIIQQKNLLTITVTNYRMYRDDQQVIFVLEFDAATSLAQQVLDYDEIRRELDSQRDIAQVFGHKYQPNVVDKFIATYQA